MAHTPAIVTVQAQQQSGRLRANRAVDTDLVTLHASMHYPSTTVEPWDSSYRLEGLDSGSGSSVKYARHGQRLDIRAPR